MASYIAYSRRTETSRLGADALGGIKIKKKHRDLSSVAWKKGNTFAQGGLGYAHQMTKDMKMLVGTT